MFVPKMFSVSDQKIIEDFIVENSFATLVSQGTQYPTGTHIPLELEVNDAGQKVLWGHIAKANLQVQELQANPNVLAIFLSSIHSYISSSWYNHPNVPTWNYMSVHVRGQVKIIEGEQLWESLRRLTDKYEKGMKNPLNINKLPDREKRQIQGIVGLEISIKSMDVAFKLSQNRNDEDFANILKELRSDGSATARLMFEAMERQRALKT
jgi:transcriptional regulator